MPDPVMTALQETHGNYGTPVAPGDADLENWFGYHPAQGDQPERYTRVRAAALEFARVVCAECPQSADRTTAVRTIRQAMQWAIASIACGGR
jgi:hypothetical protein